MIRSDERWNSPSVDTWRELLRAKVADIEARQTTSLQGLYDQIADLTEPQAVPLDAASNYINGDYYALSVSGTFSTSIPELSGLSGGAGDQIIAIDGQWLLLEFSGDFLSSVIDDTAAGTVTFTPVPKTPTTPVVADDITRKGYVDAQDAAHAALQSDPDDVHGTKVYADSKTTGWLPTPSVNDWVPTAADQWIGDDEQHPEGVAVGVPTGDPNNIGIQGVFARRSDTPSTEPGVAVVGFVDQETRIAGSVGSLANAPVEIAGAPVFIMGPVYLNAQNPRTTTNYLLVGPTSALPDGRLVAPVTLGPEYIPAQSESATDTRDLPLTTTLTDVFATPLTLANNYIAGSIFIYNLRLSEEGGRTAEFDIEIWVNGAFVYRDEYNISGQSQNISISYPTDSALSIGDVIQVRASAVETHPSSDPWIRGATWPSKIELRQG